MNQYFITGTSSGLGLELAKQLLENEHNRVFGISRRQAIEHEQYTHFRLDLCNIDFSFPIKGDEDQLIFINNAGWIGEVAPMGSEGLDHDAIHESFHINLVSPTILINQFVSQVHQPSERRV